MEDLSPIQYQALCLLAAGKTREEVAQETGVTSRTIDNWRKNPSFQKLLRESVSKVFDQAIAELCSGAVEAARELKKIISDDETPKRIKVSAIQVLLVNASKAKELILEERIENIEAALDGDIIN